MFQLGGLLVYSG